jgi:hypothetical protein
MEDEPGPVSLWRALAVISIIANLILLDQLAK